jgi:hypothetical protein
MKNERGGEAAEMSTRPAAPRTDDHDWLALYDLERYVLSQVHDRFHTDGTISAFDFFCIVAWKSNRSRSKIAARLLRHAKSLESAVQALAADLWSATSPKERFDLLIQRWGFRLPTASAVLSVLYPDVFTVYDWRVCEQLGEHRTLADWSNPERLWEGYQAYITAVRSAAPDGLSLRDKDRYLWARSFGKDLERGVASDFNHRKEGRLA